MCVVGVSCECAVGYHLAPRSRPMPSSGNRQHLTRALACACVCARTPGRVCVCGVCASVRVRAPQGVCGRVRTRVGARMGAGAGVRACVMYM